MTKPKGRLFYVIAAVDEQGGIGKDGGLPWRIPSELAYFKAVTSAAIRGRRNAVIMGRNTWESIPEKFRPLSNRLNIVLTRDLMHVAHIGLPGMLFASTLEHALDLVDADGAIDDVFIIGGAQLYKEAVVHPNCEAIFLTLIKGTYDCDTFFPSLKREWIRVAYEEQPQWMATVYKRVRE